MKIRTGFVSNSSTTSFHIYGVEIKRSDFKNLKKDSSQNTSSEDADKDFEDEDYDDDFYEFLEEKIPNARPSHQ
jgi:hypothetical protein